MTATVEMIFRYQAYCPECPWWSTEIETEEAAEDAAQEHNEQEHG